MSKGSRQRPASISKNAFDTNWAKIFEKKPTTCVKCKVDPTTVCEYCGLQQSTGKYFKLY